MVSDTITTRRDIIRSSGFIVPCVIMTPGEPIGSAVVVHGYGGCKEEQLGLAWRLAESGICACAIDLRGHGEHMRALDDRVLDDVNAAVNYCRNDGKVAVVGHSLGGRLASVCDAGYAVAISPALDTAFTPQTRELLTSNRGYRVRENGHGSIFDILQKLPAWHYGDSKPVTLVYGSRDIPEVVSACEEQKAKGADVVKIEHALHSDIITLDGTFSAVSQKLREWFYKD